MRRNALVALGNVGQPDDPEVIDTLRQFLAHDDPMLRAHAAGAARALKVNELLEIAAADPHPLVQAELVD